MPYQRSRPPSMTDVANLAGVSYQTVSRVVNSQGPVAESTRARVLAAIAELGYHPNSAARALVTGRGRTVAVLASNTALYGYAYALQGIEEAARDADLDVVITVLGSTSEAEVRATTARVLAQPLAGVISLTHDDAGTQALDAVPAGVTAIGVGGTGTGPGRRLYARLDEHGGAVAATRYLLELGHATVHHIALPNSEVTDRGTGWLQVLREEGRAVPEPLQGTWHPESAYRRGAELAARPDVTAVLCGNDQLCVGLLRALTDAGRRVPEDVSVIGFDDEPWAGFLRPSLTTVRQDFAEIGRRSVALLLAQLAGRGDTRSELVPTTLVVRESTAPPPAR
ncbi:LacI family DNA-binding transcriptional regulator [Kineococcus sp. NUM-3379]